MSVAPAGRAPASYEIKSANLPLMALLLKSDDLRQLAAEWERQYGDSPDFFDHDPLIIDLSPLPEAVQSLDFARLIAFLRAAHLLPIAFKGGNASLVAQALAAGLVAAPDAVPHTEARTPEVVEVVREIEVVREVSVPMNSPVGALVVDKPLRSGQQVYAKGRDLVVLSMVNPGAEVIADGHIHVYAPLRGKAIAGARGLAEARIFTLCLEAELISIAGVYRTSDIALPPEVLSKPTQIRLEGDAQSGKLIMEALKS